MVHVSVRPEVIYVRPRCTYVAEEDENTTTTTMAAVNIYLNGFWTRPAAAAAAYDCIFWANA